MCVLHLGLSQGRLDGEKHAEVLCSHLLGLVVGARCWPSELLGDAMFSHEHFHDFLVVGNLLIELSVLSLELGISQLLTLDHLLKVHHFLSEIVLICGILHFPWELGHLCLSFFVELGCIVTYEHGFFILEFLIKVYGLYWGIIKPFLAYGGAINAFLALMGL